MKHLKTFNEKMLTSFDQDINIRVDIEATRHATDRFFRHGLEDKIDEGDIIEMVEDSIEELTIALMQNKLNVGEKFVIRDDELDLSFAAVINAGRNEFKLTVITVRKGSFRTWDDQYVLTL